MVDRSSTVGMLGFLGDDGGARPGDVDFLRSLYRACITPPSANIEGRFACWRGYSGFLLVRR